MLISGVQKFSILDYPEKTSCIVFTPGCNFRCGFCHNPEFVLPEEIEKVQSSFFHEEPFFNFLTTRKNRLDGVVITGGEPTLQKDLLSFMEKVKEMGFLVKLDSNGNRADILQEAIEKKFVDYIAMDIKSSLSEYKNVVGGGVNIEEIQKSIDLLKQGLVDYEFRSTLLPKFHTEPVLADMRKLISGCKRYYLQNFLPEITLEKSFQNECSFPPQEMEDIAEFFRKEIPFVKVRK
ncbi:MAG: anaerobic ribonucleoside-triphosphate reductase activating protein [Candidatus Magasanikbacteria bacterium]